MEEIPTCVAIPTASEGFFTPLKPAFPGYPFLNLPSLCLLDIQPFSMLNGAQAPLTDSFEIHFVFVSLSS